MACEAISCMELFELMCDVSRCDGSTLVTLDVRGLTTFSKGHIKGSHNFSLSKLLVRRLVHSSLETMLGDAVKVIIFSQHDTPKRTIVVYNGDGECDPATSIMRIVSTCLVKETKSSIRELSGGYNEFSKSHPEKCVVSAAPRAMGLCSTCETSAERCRCRGAGPFLAPLSAPVMTQPRALSLAQRRGIAGTFSGVAGVTGATAAAVLSPIRGGDSPPYSRSDSGLGEDRFPSEIQPFLFLGSARHAADLNLLQGKGITAILNITTNCPCSFEDKLTYRKIPVEDNGTANLLPHLQETNAFIDSVRQKGGRVLLHCVAGISRSPTVCAAYLMQSQGMDFRDALDWIRARRPAIGPNINFLGQLVKYQETLPGSKMVSLHVTPSPPVFVARCQPLATSSGERSPEDTGASDVPARLAKSLKISAA